MEQSFNLPNNRVLKVVQDESPDSPREWDNLTKLILFGKYSHLGDKHNINANDFDGWDENKTAVMKEYDVAIIKPLYMYSHSGQTISTSPFSCPWDSGQLGWVIVTKEDLRNNWCLKRISKKYRQFADNVLESEIDVLDMYVRGDVYGYILVDNDEEDEDSCFGFYGSDITKNGILDYFSDEDREEVLKQL